MAFGLASTSTSKAGRRKAPTVNPLTGKPIRVLTGTRLTASEIRTLLEAHGFPAESIPKAIAIAMHESGGDPGATVDTRGLSDADLHAFWGPSYDGVRLDPHGEYACGLWQTNVRANPQYDPVKLLDTDYAAQAFFKQSKGGKDFTPWTVHAKGGKG